jgi:enterochelin esterase family protein
MILLLGMFIMNIDSSTPSTQFNTFEEFLEALNSTPLNDKEQLIQSYLNEKRSAKNIPVIEPTNCTFLYYGNKTVVEIAGDFTAWSPKSMHRATDANLWYLTETFPSDSRLDYKLVIEGNWILDPENDATVLGGFGYNSEISMPSYESDPSIKYFDYVPHGKIDTIPNFQSISFNNFRTIKVYLPPNYNPNESKLYPTLYVTDGIEYIDIAKFQNVLDYLLYNGLIAEIIVVFIPPINRNSEYFDEKAIFIDFITGEAIPFITANYKVSQNRTDRGLMGASLGGYISFYTGFNKEDAFGLIASQSGYFPYDLIGMYGSRVPNIKYYFDIGTFESLVGGLNLVTLNREMNQTMTNKGYTFRYQEINEGHSWGNWQTHLDDILTYFFPGTGISQNTTTTSTDSITTPNSQTSSSSSSSVNHSESTNTSTTTTSNQTTNLTIFGLIFSLFVTFLKRKRSKD